MFDVPEQLAIEHLRWARRADPDLKPRDALRAIPREYWPAAGDGWDAVTQAFARAWLRDVHG